MAKSNGFLARMAAMLAMANFNHGMSMSGSASGCLRQRFNLAGLPPAWKGKRMARIMRGGK